MNGLLGEVQCRSQRLQKGPGKAVIRKHGHLGLPEGQGVRLVSCGGGGGGEQEMGTEVLQFRADIIGQRSAASHHGNSQSEMLRLWLGVKVSKEGTKNASFVLTLGELLSNPCRGDAMPPRHGQPLLATVPGRKPREGPGNQLELEMEKLNMLHGTICASL